MENTIINRKKFSIINKLLLAPMVRIGTTPFRRLILKHGADYVFTEEIIAKKLEYCDRKFNKTLGTWDYVSTRDGVVVLRIHPSEKEKLILQIGASDPDSALKAVEVVRNDICAVDVNMGCPKHFSTHGGMGSALLLMPDLSKQILENLVKNSGLPVSCKIRLLPDFEKSKNFIEMIQNTGITYFTVHFRLKDQEPRFKADWRKIKDVAKIAKIPFIVNGDIMCPNDILKLKNYGLCHGFMIARGAIHNPRIFEEFKEKFDKFELTDEIVRKNREMKGEEEFENEIEELKDDQNYHHNANILHKKFNINGNNNNIGSILELNESNQNTILNDSNPKSNEKIIEKKRKKIEDEEADDMKTSQNLARILDLKYEGRKLDIEEIIKDYIKLSIDSANAFKNSKYNILYILKTHKKNLRVFQAIQVMKNYEEICKYFEMEEYLKEKIDSDPDYTLHLNLTYYRQIYGKNDKKIEKGNTTEKMNADKLDETRNKNE